MNDPIPMNFLQKKPFLPLATLRCPNMIAVASGKGGVGKTTLSVGLCQTLAQEGKNVLLFDGDFGLANVDIQLGLTPSKDMVHVLKGEMSLKEAITYYENGKFDILPGRSGSGNLATLPLVKLTDLRTSLIKEAPSYDYVLVDLGAGIDRAVRHMSGPAASTYVVLTDEPTSMTDAYAFIKLSRAANPNADLRIIVNMAKTKDEGKRIYNTIAKACQNFLGYTPQLAGVVRRDPKVRESIRNQMPILTRHPSSDAAQDIAEVAKNILTI